MSMIRYQIEWRLRYLWLRLTRRTITKEELFRELAATKEAIEDLL